ncbi:tyrosine-type recombinase/integrase [Sinorhizobium fredii]|uniref:Integrase family protein n=1 Tax=Rhizobium fredii TaxID=380 RepID=A0A2L0H9L6_RHIFR|nr:site-specific integrase [Sinorhizobium fredii]AUX78117.1 integrase family protein [Sinorhizobium fredii]
MALNTKRIAKLNAPGRYRDPETRGLYLQVGRTGTKSWLLRYELNGRERFHGLGSLDDFSLKEARERARAARQKIADGIDPIDVKRAERAARAVEAAKAVTFEEAARQYFDQNEPRWRNRKAAAQFLSTMEDYVFPVFGKVSIAQVDTGLVLKALEREHPNRPGKSVWMAIPETANRIRGRIENVLDWATTRGYRDGENPARWRGHLQNVLPARGKIQRVEHHPAMPYSKLPTFMAQLAKREGVAAKALEFTILTAARTGEVIGATWDEIDLDGKVWTVPAGRMKASKEHRVPLSDRAALILNSLPREKDNPFVFIGARSSGLSNMAMAAVLKRLDRNDVTVHGFRSTFRDWAAELTSYANHIVEQALAHTIGNAVERAYRRGDLFEKRVRLMTDWSRFCANPAPVGKVVPMRTAE